MAKKPATKKPIPKKPATNYKAEAEFEQADLTDEVIEVASTAEAHEEIKEATSEEPSVSSPALSEEKTGRQAQHEAESTTTPVLQSPAGLTEEIFLRVDVLWSKMSDGMPQETRFVLGAMGLLFGVIGLYYLIPAFAQVDFGQKLRSLIFPLHHSVIVKGFLLGLWIFISLRFLTPPESEA